MNIILLSGGSGKRLWPLSNEIRSKQFIKILKKPEDIGLGYDYESMVQRVFRQIKAVDKEATVTIATSESQVPSIHNQVGMDVGISIEPCRRDTFPAIALATAYLHDVQGVPEDEAVVVCPVDPYVDDDYFDAVRELCNLAEAGESKLVLMGIDPTYPSEKYGYIIPVSEDKISKVSEFKEKPDVKTAEEYIAQGGLWNGGVFAYKLGYVLDRARELLNYTDYTDLLLRFEELTKISFDYAVVEHEKDISVMRYKGQWQDLGSWNTFTDAMDGNVFGNATLSEDCTNVSVVNELGIPVLGVGLKDLVIAASSDGILVTDKEKSSGIKTYVEKFDQQVMYAEQSWGEYRVLDVEENCQTIKIMIKAGHKIEEKSNDSFDVACTVMMGTGTARVDGMEQSLRAGDVITITKECKYSISADTDMMLIEARLYG